MAPKHRIAHTTKFTEHITNKVTFTPSEPSKRKFLDEEAKETKYKKQKRFHNKKVPSKKQIDQKPLVNADPSPPQTSYASNRVSYNRSFESRHRCLPDFVEKKINSLIEFVNNLPKRPLRKRKIIPVKGITEHNVYARIYQNPSHR